MILVNDKKLLLASILFRFSYVLTGDETLLIAFFRRAM